MTTFRNAALAAIALACLSSGARAEDRTPVLAHIAVADLNLVSPQGIATLRQRVRRAISVACREDSRDLRLQADSARCRAEMNQDGNAQIAGLIERRDVQVAAR